MPKVSKAPTTLIHFKVEVCRSIDPVALATTIFGTHKHLVVMHKGKKENPHWHFQGDTEMTSTRLISLFKATIASHSKLIANPQSRPLKQAKKKVDELGYQYMLKEQPPHVVTMCGFTEEDIDSLHEASLMHVQQLKDKVYDYLLTKIDMSCLGGKPGGRKLDPTGEADCKARHKQFQMLCMDYYSEKDIMWPPNLQKLILYYMLKMARQQGVFELYKGYVSTRA